MMTSQARRRRVAVGAFESRDKAEAAIAELENAGFPGSEIGIAARAEQGEWTEFQPAEADPAENRTLEGAGTGSRWALGIAAGMLPALGPVIAGGLLASILASAATGAAAGGLAGSLIGLGLSDESARTFEAEFARGRVIVVVRGGDRFDQASRIMLSQGAIEVTATPAATA
jgi:hypothetical protein